MWPHGIVVSALGLAHALGFCRGVEELAVQKFGAESAIGDLDEATLARATRRAIFGSGTDRCNPILNGLSHKLGTFV